MHLQSTTFSNVGYLCVIAIFRRNEKWILKWFFVLRNVEYVCRRIFSHLTNVAQTEQATYPYLPLLSIIKSGFTHRCLTTFKTTIRTRREHNGQVSNSFSITFYLPSIFLKVCIRVGPILQKWREAEIWHVIIARVGHKIKNVWVRTIRVFSPNRAHPNTCMSHKNCNKANLKTLKVSTNWHGTPSSKNH